MGEIFTNYKFDAYSVKPAKETDIGAVLNLLRNAAFWLKEKGINQWEYLRNGGEDREIKEDILAGTTYLVEDSARNAVATFNLSPRQNSWDIAIWGKRNDHAYYLHRLAVNRGYHNSQVGKKLLYWINENNCIGEGFLRLDCIANNPVLNRYYQEAGYRFIGYTGEGEDKFSKYEKTIDE